MLVNSGLGSGAFDSRVIAAGQELVRRMSTSCVEVELVCTAARDR